MPFALQSVRALARAGWQVDVFLWQKNIDDLLPGDDANITFRQTRFLKLPLPNPPLKKLHAVRSSLHALRFAITGRYQCVFGLGQFGIIVARLMTLIARCPLVYFNEELPSAWPQTVLTKMERWAARGMNCLISPDAVRNPQILSELQLPEDTPAGVLYNVPVVDVAPPEIDWHQRLGIPHDKHVVSHAGALADWAQVPEVLATVPSWPEDVVLLLHSSTSAEAQRYRKGLSHLQIDDRVYWSEDPLPEEELHSLLSSSLACLGLYRVASVNIELMGYSSGKIMRSLVCGTPVIASAIPSLGFVTKNGLGVQVRHPSEIASHLPLFIEEREQYRQRCLQFTRNQISFDKAWEVFCDDFASISGIDLARPYHGKQIKS
jgi:glycosyltransferase involved in cell wall biosynthesis